MLLAAAPPKALRPDVPVIMIASPPIGDADTKRTALENGAETLFTKPSISGRFAARATCGLNAPPLLAKAA